METTMHSVNPRGEGQTNQLYWYCSRTRNDGVALQYRDRSGCNNEGNMIAKGLNKFQMNNNNNRNININNSQNINYHINANTSNHMMIRREDIHPQQEYNSKRFGYRHYGKLNRGNINRRTFHKNKTFVMDDDQFTHEMYIPTSPTVEGKPNFGTTQTNYDTRQMKGNFLQQVCHPNKMNPCMKQKRKWKPTSRWPQRGEGNSVNHGDNAEEGKTHLEEDLLMEGSYINEEKVDDPPRVNKPKLENGHEREECQDGEDGKNGEDGEDGKNGEDGEDGEDGEEEPPWSERKKRKSYSEIKSDILRDAIEYFKNCKSTKAQQDSDEDHVVVKDLPMEEENNAQNQKPSYCNVCKEKEYKYKCPFCEIKSCSLICVKAHKKLFQCKNKLKKIFKIKNIGRNNFDENTLHKDYLYLENVEKILRGNYKFIKIKEYETTNIWLYRYSKLINLLKKKNIFLLKAPMYTKLHRENKTNIINNEILWMIKVTFVNENIFVIHENICEDTSFLQILNLSITKVQKLKHILTIYLNNLDSIHISLSNTYTNKKKKNQSEEIDLSFSVLHTLSDLLLGKTFYEYPHINFKLLYEGNSLLVNSAYERVAAQGACPLASQAEGGGCNKSDGAEEEAKESSAIETMVSNECFEKIQ
ncbi:hypothetical protein, conserved [Plasmodium gonderi]|uniref:HIT-type domain-containing protein n=1 Tax=Plasmodium gonderi TaxID=77519 RepID=A0A1Y1JFX9_PLAGO|nr:hypothetical protein, conserved [Plasmodium gonderi]GAW78994.1 hypothetical protein, conserved [Plasmodium gonderi]